MENYQDTQISRVRESIMTPTNSHNSPKCIIRDILRLIDHIYRTLFAVTVTYNTLKKIKITNIKNKSHLKALQIVSILEEVWDKHLKIGR